MSWWTEQVQAGVVRGVTATIITQLLLGAMIVFGFSAPQFIADTFFAPPWWLVHPIIRIGILLVGLLLIWLVFAWSSKKPASKPKDTPAQVEKSSWEQELHELRFDRRDFWRLIKTAHQNWSMNPDPGRSIDDLVRSANWPSELPLKDNSQFAKWVWEADKSWKGDTKKLWTFVSQIYVPVKPPKAVKTQIMGTTHEFDRFDTIRMELSKFWDHWGRQEPLEQVIREQKADGLVKGHREELKLLTFLEIARPKWAQTGAEGKSGLFQLGRRNAESEE